MAEVTLTGKLKIDDNVTVYADQPGVQKEAPQATIVLDHGGRTEDFPMSWQDGDVLVISVDRAPRK